MTGHILIVDSIATNRCVLRAKLAASFLEVRQAETGREALDMIRAEPPDLVILGGDLTDMSADHFLRHCAKAPDMAAVPLVVYGTGLSREERLTAMRAGADDALNTPIAEAPFLARIRCLLRARATIEGIKLQETAAQIPGLAEDDTPFDVPASLVVTSSQGAEATGWSAALKPLVPYRMRALPIGDAVRSMSLFAVPDAFVIGVNTDSPEEGLRFLAEIRARATTRHAAILVVLNREDDIARVNALDLGANDVMPAPFDPEEATLRLATILKRKKLTDRLSRSLERGLNAAVTDPLTGLYNRRYALPQLARIARHAHASDHDYAVMVADLDYFKRVNDQYGHAAGDVVLAEVARRLRSELKGGELIARIGGEEFLIVLPQTSAQAASERAHQLCEAVRKSPVYLRARDVRIPVTISIGVSLGADMAPDGPPPMTEADAVGLIDQADKALYNAKACGRDSVTITRPAA
ncbi:diguanylate cyclase [Shimia haliotis]|uniref:diguanylate cyclase n=1 Tax=Shimia haliotis TaxID=1280847 RepID=A0A1I3ZW18_9RHOB|nr:diguanylate cyclase [Shimia haliotis]SFK48268.1 two-component system, cell cycle response regulator [Shimia haliotis]